MNIKISILNVPKHCNKHDLIHFVTGCLIWGRCSTSNTLRLLKLQKRAARLILNADILTSSKWLFQELKRVQYHMYNMIYKALNGQTPEYISDCFTKISETHNRNLRSVDNDLLHIPNSRTHFYENSFTVSAAKLWNQIPLHIRNINCLNSFKTALKSYLQAN